MLKINTRKASYTDLWWAVADCLAELMTREDENVPGSPAITTRGELGEGNLTAHIAIEVDTDGSSNSVDNSPLLEIVNYSYNNDSMASNRIGIPVSKSWVAKVQKAHNAECKILREALRPVKYRLLNNTAKQIFQNGRLAHSFNEKKVAQARKFASLL